MGAIHHSQIGTLFYSYYKPIETESPLPVVSF